ncbi:MAG: hypothetical protein LE180_06260 [Endomicrobium sp.]|uniref:hypothetical protein n=1 Tax=Candidatus Endomicrobiellum pyrsonymphae TaxID=1408203 RepID=UPI0035851777|nr:hypothetical protein [Endomicrobium sp.]
MHDVALQAIFDAGNREEENVKNRLGYEFGDIDIEAKIEYTKLSIATKKAEIDDIKNKLETDPLLKKYAVCVQRKIDTLKRGVEECQKD